MCGSILMLLLFAANSHNFLRVLGAVDDYKMTKQLIRKEMDQYMDVLEMKSMLNKILQANNKVADRLEKVEKIEETLEVVKTQVKEMAHFIKLSECQRWRQTQNLNKTNLIKAEGTYFYFNLTEVDWNKSSDWCAERGMEMVILKTQSQIDAVKKGLNEHGSYEDYYWLGASDVGHTPGQFRWADGTLVDGNTWLHGKIHKYRADWNETTCVQFHPVYAKLSDERCAYGRCILCQVPSALAACL